MTQYGLRLSHEIHDMPWAEFCQYLAGLSSETPLGKMIQLRTETNPDMLKSMTPGQRRIRSEWQQKRAAKLAQKISPEQMSEFLEQMKQAFISMSERT